MTAPRPDLFTPIHKAIRALLYDLAAEAQRTDHADAAASAATCDRIERGLDLMLEHGAHEDAEIFPALAACAPALAARLETQHHSLHHADDEVRAGIIAIRTAADAHGRQAAGARMVRALNALVGMQSLHMNAEEEEAMPALLARYADDELVAIRARIVASQSPERYEEWLRLMIPALHDGELTGMLAGLKASAPEPVVHMVLRVAEDVLDGERHGRVLARLAAA